MGVGLDAETEFLTLSLTASKLDAGLSPSRVSLISGCCEAESADVGEDLEPDDWPFSMRCSRSRMRDSV